MKTLKNLALSLTLGAGLLSADILPIPHCYPCDDEPKIQCRIVWFVTFIWGVPIIFPMEICEPVQ